MPHHPIRPRELFDLLGSPSPSLATLTIQKREEMQAGEAVPGGAGMQNRRPRV